MSRSIGFKISNSDQIFHRLSGSPIRYGIAFLIFLTTYVVTIFFGRILESEVYLLPFITILLASVLGGLGPGLLATALTATIGYGVGSGLSTGELVRLLIEGTLVSAVGGTLRAERLKAHARLKDNIQLEKQILEIGDEERRRIGYDLHDGLGQHLTGISLITATMAKQAREGEQPDAAKVEMVTRLVTEAIGITRDVAKTLSPVTLESDKLGSALVELAETSASLMGIRCICESEVQDLALDRARSLHLYRIVQEAVNNSVRHGKARNVRIDVTHDRKNVKIAVTDDGVGLSAKTMVNPGLGLRIMNYRATILGASLSAERLAADGGTVVRCICPLHPRPL